MYDEVYGAWEERVAKKESERVRERRGRQTAKAGPRRRKRKKEEVKHEGQVRLLRTKRVRQARKFTSTHRFAPSSL